MVKKFIEGFLAPTEIQFKIGDVDITISRHFFDRQIERDEEILSNKAVLPDKASKFARILDQVIQEYYLLEDVVKVQELSGYRTRYQGEFPVQWEEEFGTILSVCLTSFREKLSGFIGVKTFFGEEILQRIKEEKGGYKEKGFVMRNGFLYLEEPK